MPDKFHLTGLLVVLVLLLGCGGPNTSEPVATADASPLTPAPAAGVGAGVTQPPKAVPPPAAPAPPVAKPPDPADEGDFNPFAPKPVTKPAATAAVPPKPAAAGPAPVAPAPAIKAPAALPPALADVADVAKQAVVRITATLPDGEVVGTGFVANAEGTWIVTNAHVIAGARSADAMFNDGEQVKINGYAALDEKRDLVVLEIPSRRPARSHLKLQTKLPSRGDTIVALSAPRGVAFTASDGIVSSTRDGNEMQTLLGPTYTNPLITEYVQITAPISPESSGGPLINALGDVIGINTYFDNQGLNFAVGAITVRNLLLTATQVNRTHAFPTPRRDVAATAPRPFQPVAKVPAKKAAAPSWEIVLPDGKHFSSAMCTIDETRLKRMRLNATGGINGIFPAVIEYTSGKPRAVAWHKNGVLDAGLVSVTETGAPKILAQYDDGKIDENLILVDENGDMSLFAQFEKGRLEGIRCQFHKGLPLLVGQYSKDRLTAFHWIQNGAVAKSFDTVEAIGADDQAVADAHALLLKTVEDYAAEERTLRKAVREIDLDDRQARAAVLSVEKRARERARNERRAAISREIIQSLQRMSGLYR